MEGFAIGELDGVSGRWRYLGARSTDDSLWSTEDPARARVWPSADAARSWAEHLPIGTWARLSAKFTRVVPLAGGESAPLDDPLDDLGWIDGRTIDPADLRAAMAEPLGRAPGEGGRLSGTFRGCVDIGNTLAIEAGGRVHYFEVPANCGLCCCTADGREKADPKPSDPFWRAADLWRKQGMRVVDGLCAWEPEAPDRFRHLGGNHYEYDPDGPLELIDGKIVPRAPGEGGR